VNLYLAVSKAVICMESPLNREFLVVVTVKFKTKRLQNMSIIRMLVILCIICICISIEGDATVSWFLLKNTVST
jgi:hypothetical protein